MNFIFQHCYNKLALSVNNLIKKNCVDNTVILKKQMLRVKIYVRKKLTTKINILLNYRNIKESRIFKSNENLCIIFLYINNVIFMFTQLWYMILLLLNKHF